MGTMKYWLNIDKPTRFAKLHRDTCRFCKPYAQNFKGINEVNDHGGWFEFNSPEEAYAFFRDNFPQTLWQPCKKCLKNLEKSTNSFVSR
jgi:hypothetical protein